jgi:outer membrane protein OmpA-like peptidoglycan-associated protein
MRTRWASLPLAVVAVLLSFTAWAAEGYNAHRFYPTPFAGRYLTFEDAQTLPQLRWALGAIADYAHMPVETRADNERTGGVLDSVLTTTITGAFSAHDMVNVGLQMPIHWFNRGRSYSDLGGGDGGSRQNATSMGDIHLLTKVRILEEGIWPFGLAVTPYFTVPSGDATRLLGEGRLTAGATVTYEIDAVWLRIALNGGWRYRGGSDVLGTSVRNAFPVAIGIGRDVIEPLNLTLEMFGEFFESENNRDFSGNPLELDLVGRYKLTKDWRLLGGLGAGLTSGVGSPDFRLFAGADFYPKPVVTPPPSTGNLRVVVQDKFGKPLDAEVSLQGPELRLGNTTDGVFALSNLAPGNYQVRASRPDYETGTADAAVFAGQTAVVTVALDPLETRLTIIVLDKDKGQRVPSRLIFQPGTAQEQVIDNPSGEYTATTAPGPVTFTAEAKGYESLMTTVTVEPHTTTTATVTLRRKIELAGKIFFDFNSAKLRPISAPVLREVARQIKDQKPKRVIVEGHCSDEGTDEYNLKLSQGRAESVREFLIKEGVSAALLRVMAFGESRPIASNETEEGRERNRRVEFILEGE